MLKSMYYFNLQIHVILFGKLIFLINVYAARLIGYVIVYQAFCMSLINKKQISLNNAT